MLKELGFIDGSLCVRINEAISNGILTRDMGNWAHQIGLDGNDQRHSDLAGDLPTVMMCKKKSGII
ncbi:DUF4145 domain-containing protein [[Flexibacter] sp. ATCC 35208]|uniref:DUF4145 domain-containing protein n=1 Tax=[Flexibacter] sp. ATCC 35208 TaxID=1936242 RepID=UPI0009C7E6A5|nr:hypothetical protein BW716_20325 [[Flexibacter] sp. ATCC 35208]